LIGQGFGLEVSGHGWASLLACNSIIIGLDIDVFYIVYTYTQIWVAK